MNHLLVGLRFDADTVAPPAPETDLRVGDKKTGSVTSAVVSPGEGPLALAFVRREHAEPGTEVVFEGGRATVSPLPFVALPERVARPETS